MPVCRYPRSARRSPHFRRPVPAKRRSTPCVDGCCGPHVQDHCFRCADRCFHRCHGSQSAALDLALALHRKIPAKRRAFKLGPAIGCAAIRMALETNSKQVENLPLHPIGPGHRGSSESITGWAGPLTLVRRRTRASVVSKPVGSSIRSGGSFGKRSTQVASLSWLKFSSRSPCNSLAAASSILWGTMMVVSPRYSITCETTLGLPRAKAVDYNTSICISELRHVNGFLKG